MVLSSYGYVPYHMPTGDMQTNGICLHRIDTDTFPQSLVRMFGRYFDQAPPLRSWVVVYSFDTVLLGILTHLYQPPLRVYLITLA